MGAVGREDPQFVRLAVQYVDPALVVHGDGGDGGEHRSLRPLHVADRQRRHQAPRRILGPEPVRGIHHTHGAARKRVHDAGPAATRVGSAAAGQHNDERDRSQKTAPPERACQHVCIRNHEVLRAVCLMAHAGSADDCSPASPRDRVASCNMVDVARRSRDRIQDYAPCTDASTRRSVATLGVHRCGSEGHAQQRPTCQPVTVMVR